jgi:putative transposase
MCIPHECYLELDRNDEERYKAYRELFSETLSEQKVEAIRIATQRGLVVGSEDFKARIESIVGESVYPNPVGRPPRIDEPIGLYFV